MTHKHRSVCVAGCGPAGIMAALAAARDSARVRLIDPHEPPGAKILASGGGRCNLTNTLDRNAFMEKFGKRGRFMSHALGLLSPAALRASLSARGIATSADSSGRIFPEGGARVVHAVLMRALRAAGISVAANTRMERILTSSNRIAGIDTNHGPIACDALIVATGGCSYPSLGSDGSGIRAISSLGLRIAEPVPALVPLVAREKMLRTIAGVSLRGVRVLVAGEKRTYVQATGDVLFTHRGLSGPAVLDVSGEVAMHLRNSHETTVCIQVDPSLSVLDWHERIRAWRNTHGRRRVGNALGLILPSRFASLLLVSAGLSEDCQLSHLDAASEQRLCELLASFPVAVSGTEGFDVSMVTRGGVDLKEIDPRTMQSRKIEGLFFAGEIVDLDGPTGGFNLQWAFSSGNLAGASSARCNA